jgi:hypothetical protein
MQPHRKDAARRLFPQTLQTRLKTVVTLTVVFFEVFHTYRTHTKPYPILFPQSNTICIRNYCEL